MTPDQAQKQPILFDNAKHNGTIQDVDYISEHKIALSKL